MFKLYSTRQRIPLPTTLRDQNCLNWTTNFCTSKMTVMDDKSEHREGRRIQSISEWFSGALSLSRPTTHSLLVASLSLVRPDHNMTSLQGVLQIYELLVSVAHGMKSLELRVDMWRLWLPWRWYASDKSDKRNKIRRFVTVLKWFVKAATAHMSPKVILIQNRRTLVAAATRFSSEPAQSDHSC